MKILILGAGGHGQTVAEALLCIASSGAPMSAVGFLDDTPGLPGTVRHGLPILGPLDEVDRVPHDALIVAIGENRARRRIFRRLKASGARFATIIHPTAVVASDVVIGEGSYISALQRVDVATRIGENSIISATGCIGHHNRIGDHVHFGPGVRTTGGVQVGEGAMVGVGASMIPGVSIGAWSVVGAGSVVTRDIPDRVVAFGVPAQVRRTVAAGEVDDD